MAARAFSEPTRILYRPFGPFHIATFFANRGLTPPAEVVAALRAANLQSSASDPKSTTRKQDGVSLAGV